MSEDRGVWQSKSSAKGQNRLSASKKPVTGANDRKESQPGIKGGAGRVHGTNKERGIQWQGPDSAQNSDTNSSLLPDDHMPVNGYNAVAIEAAMKAPVEPQPSVYKPADKLSPTARSGSAPWGFKPNCMANGKDFWVHLRKQYTALQRTGGTREGG